MRLVVIAALFTCALAPPAHAQRDNLAEVLRGFSTAELRAHLSFLADDLLEGRAPGSRGDRITTRYIASQFERVGLQPVGRSWLHTVTLDGWTPQPERIGVEFETRGRRIPLRYPDDVILWTRNGISTAEVSGEVVFVGYGVTAPEWRWDDFREIDLRGKILLFLASDPPAPPDEPDRFDGIAMTYYGRWSYKLEEAARRGAAGALIVHTDEAAGYPWSVVRSSWTGEQLFLKRDSSSHTALEGWIRAEPVRAALNTAGRDLDVLIARAGRRDFQPISTGLTIRASASGRTRHLESANVVGVLHGRHPTRRNEAVVIAAHWDHLGIGPAENGDSIYNGAYDNAGGVAAVVEIARAFAAVEPAPDRSVIFIATTAEEAGLLGTSFYVENPAFPIARTAAAIAIDGANLWGETFDVAAVGAERSTLGRIAETRARDLGLRLSPERAPEKGVFYRSDHFPFARAGVPALLIDHGLEFKGRPPGWGARTLARYETDHYHKPSDAFSTDFDLEGAAQQARFAFLIAYDVARAPAFPQWHPGAEFSSVRGR